MVDGLTVQLIQSGGRAGPCCIDVSEDQSTIAFRAGGTSVRTCFDFACEADYGHSVRRREWPLRADLSRALPQEFRRPPSSTLASPYAGSSPILLGVPSEIKGHPRTCREWRAQLVWRVARVARPFGSGRRYPKRAQAWGFTGSGFVRPTAKFTNAPQYCKVPVRNSVQSRL